MCWETFSIYIIYMNAPTSTKLNEYNGGHVLTVLDSGHKKTIASNADGSKLFCASVAIRPQEILK